MTERYLGSIITANPVEPSANTENSAASGVWNIHDPLIFGQASDWPDPTVASPNKFVENLFSTFVYTGTGSSRTINNGIDVSNEGGLVWIKPRTNTNNHRLHDTERGAGFVLSSNLTQASESLSTGVTSFNSNGFTLGTNSTYNGSGVDFASWTFRKASKFFDIVTYSGTGSARTVSHNLGSVPGMIFVKRTDSTANWNVYHNGLNGGTNPEQYGINLNASGAEFSSSGYWNNTAPTATEFTVGTSGNANASGGTYVAYLFAHNNNDGGFGSAGDQDIIKCGSYSGNGSETAGTEVNLGFEPQWLMVKASTTTANWFIIDNIRGWGPRNTGSSSYLRADTGAAESSSSNTIELTSTGFKAHSTTDDWNGSGQTYIYVAIRRGLMQTPTAATDVFDVQTYTGDSSQNRKITTNFVVDANITSGFTINYRTCWGARLYDGMHETSQTAVSYYNLANWMGYDHNDGYIMGENTNYSYQNASSQDYVSYSFSRAPKFFDVVTYAGDSSSNRAVAHNLEVAPEFIVIKSIANADNWRVTTTDAFPNGYRFNSGGAVQTGVSAFSGASTPNATNFYVSNDGEVNASGRSYVAYLFATLAGISKVGTYSGTGNDVNVDCGFTSGARFVLVKRKDSSGDWYHWDNGTANGIADSTDPYLLLNSDAARVTNTDYIDPLSSGFTITSNAGSDLNASGGTYTFLAIA